MLIEDKLTILADAAKFDVSCASSGSRRNNIGRWLGNTTPSGICHTYTEDGRCVSLLKILYTNICIYNCAYCVNRFENDVPRAAFTAREITTLTIDFYRRNYIEGLFLSSGIMRSPDDTMERLVQTVKKLRKEGFNGYIHLKCVPFASRRLIRKAGRYADRLSVNIELPSEDSLMRLTQTKTYESVLTPMDVIRDTMVESREDARRLRHVPAFAPAGQSTQLIIGVSPESDYDILTLTRRLYQQQALKRVYYSAYVPVTQAHGLLPDITEPPLRRENRLYQADWLIRLYGFSLADVIDAQSPYLNLKIDPKQAFALRHPELFPVDINSAEREMILKVPGIGLKSADRIVCLRRHGRIRFEHLKKMGVAISRAQPYVQCDGLPTSLWRGSTLSSLPSAVQMPKKLEVLKDTDAGKKRLVYVIDATFEALLTAIFEAYFRKQPPDAIASKVSDQPGLFDRRIEIPTDPTKSDRVWKGLKSHLGADRRQMLYDAYLSGSSGVATAIFRYVQASIPLTKHGKSVAHIASHLEIEKLSHKVRREAHRMKGFIRFQQVKDNRYLALIEPQYDVLPLIRRHFELRFANQAWIIYDTHRNYGFYFDRQKTSELRLDIDELKAYGKVPISEEHFSQTLWQRYYAAVNIPHRNNPKLHLRQLPRRYWRYLTEKQT
ncbi:MAG: putative DNA modification/repair radical SAM protein [Desulfobacterales bacterium]|nr:putative DNA modification/repair radical SAM protein [Desulfobacterales bacterium]